VRHHGVAAHNVETALEIDRQRLPTEHDIGHFDDLLSFDDTIIPHPYWEVNMEN
jgi:hypothetical protein